MIAIALVLVTVAVYAQVRLHDFVDFDDGLYVRQNPHVTGGLTAENVAWAFTTGHAANWHPLTWISHQIDASLFGLDAGMHHVTNLIWHVVNTLLLFGLLRAMTGALWPSAFVAAFFAVHPSHVESVAWIAERKDVLSTCFWFATTWAWVTWVRRPGAVRLTIALALFALGLMAKPMLITLPFTLLLLDVWPLARTAVPFQKRVIEKLPFFALAAASSIVTFAVQQRGGAVSTLDILPPATRVANAVVGYGTYLRQLVWPVDLAVFYPYTARVPAASIAAAACVLVLVSVAAWWLRRTQPSLVVGWLWFLGTMVPVIGFVQIGMQSSADRYTYVPYVGLFIAIVWGVQAVALRLRAPAGLPLAAGAAAVLALAYLAHAQAATWRNSEALWTHAVAVTRDNAKAHNSLGAIYGNSGRVQEAEFHFKEALRLRPDMSEAVHILPNLGRALMAQGKAAEAVPILERARQTAPDNAQLLHQLALAYLATNRSNDAIRTWQDALRADPAFEDGWFTLGIALAAEGRVAEAREAFGQVVRLNPARRDAAEALARLR